MNYIPDCIFPVNNEAEIPCLNIEYQCEYLTTPFHLWGAQKRKMNELGTYFFYTDDYRFESLWKNPNKVIETNCLNAVEPNFSCYNETPLPIALYNIYRKRWIAKYWQHHKINIIVDLNVNFKFKDINLFGVPKKWKAYSTRGYNDNTEHLIKEYELACNHAETTDILFIVYGGGMDVKKLCTKYPFIHIDEEMNKIKYRYRNKIINPNQLNLWSK